MAETFDAIIIGTGQAGPALAARCSKEKLETANIERKLIGGTCVNVGCTPTKTLVASARAVHNARRGNDYGFTVGGDIRVEMQRVKARMDEVVRQSSEGLTQWIESVPRVTERLPRLIGREDEDISEAIREILEREGVEVRADAECFEVEKHGQRVVVRPDCREGAPEVEGTHLLLAVGRRPNTDDLGLEAAGIVTDSRGYVVVDDQLRTNVPGVWAVGDANGQGAFTHTAYNDYEIVAANLFDSDSRRVSDRIPAYACSSIHH